MLKKHLKDLESEQEKSFLQVSKLSLTVRRNPLKEDLEKEGVIFVVSTEGLKEYHEIFKK